MKHNKITSIFLLTLTLWLSLVVDGHASTDLEWNVIETLCIEAEPIDLVFSYDGNRLFILTNSGEILVYEAGSKPIHKMKIGSEYDQIDISPKSGMLILTSRKEKKVDFVRLVFIQDIDTSGAPFKGPEDAPVVIVVFTDFQCPYCSEIVPILDHVHEKYPEDVKIVLKNYPLRKHNFARKAAEAALAAGKKGKFWEYHDLLFQNYNKLTDEKIISISREVGLDEVEFEKLLKDPSIKNRIQKDISDGKKAGIKGTPSIFINGKAARNISLQGFDAVIKSELLKNVPLNN
jgi:protein-disulfide isomerase